MPIEHDNEKSITAIRKRAQELADSPELRGDPWEAEILAALSDGTLRFDTLDDETLDRCIQTLGIEAVVDALVEAGKKKMPAHEDQKVKVAEMPVRIREKVARQGQQMATGKGVTWMRWGWLAAAAAVILAAGIWYRTNGPGKGPRSNAPTNFALEWPPNAPFDLSSHRTWGQPNSPLAQNMPDFSKSTSTLGPGGGDERYTPWRLATVIVKSPEGWGSGTFISADGWLLTNYHVVANSAQRAALTGSPVALDIITARMTDGRMKAQPAVKATVYRVDPTHDLALLKLQSMPAGLTKVPYFKFGQSVQDGEGCFVIGSQDNGPAWWVRSGNVSQEFDFPEDLSQFAAGAASAGASIDRDRATVIVTDTRIAPGDSGGPLLNSNGELIGLTFATSANESAGSVGWHIALKHLQAFTATFPTQPEGVPFDPWTAGLPEASVLEPQLSDANHDGRIDSLIYRYASSEASGGNQPQAVAMTDFIDFTQSAHSDDPLDLVPKGLWGMETRGHYRFDVFLTVRADGNTAVGYTNRDGIVDEIRISTTSTQRENSSVIWRRNSSGQWHSEVPPTPTPLFDVARIGRGNIGLLETIAGQILGGSADHQSRGNGSSQPAQGVNRPPNKM